MADQRLLQTERLCGKKKIDELFTSGVSFIVYPYRIVYIRTSLSPIGNTAFFASVPKKKFKRAIKRNLIRRRIKEAYRLQKSELTEYVSTQNYALNMALIYLGNTIPDYSILEKKMKELLYRLQQDLGREQTS